MRHIKQYKVLSNVIDVLFVTLILGIVLCFVITRMPGHRAPIGPEKNYTTDTALKYMTFSPQYDLEPLQINTIKQLIAKYNYEERILNLEDFGSLERDAPVFVVFVDKFRPTLKYLIVSLSHLTGIEDALVIFSHSRFDKNVNNLVQTINFTRVLQIFYPYTIQVYQNEFPGFTKGDCPQSINIFKTKPINCTGMRTPDINGRYRDPEKSQLKHFWWWTMNQVFENLLIVKHHKGMFTFLEDDVFLIEDFIYMTIHIKKICKLMNDCEFISLQSPKSGNSHFEENIINNAFIVELSTWNPLNHSKVLSFDSSVWNSIAANYYSFCNYDDSLWSRSLYYLSLNRKDGNPFKVMWSRVPRALDTKSQFFFNENLEHNTIDLHLLNMFLERQEKIKNFLYPYYLEVYVNIELNENDFVEIDYNFIGGGWNDPRDKNLCSYITTNKIKKVIMDMSQEFSQYEPRDE